MQNVDLLFASQIVTRTRKRIVFTCDTKGSESCTSCLQNAQCQKIVLKCNVTCSVYKIINVLNRKTSSNTVVSQHTHRAEIINSVSRDRLNMKCDSVLRDERELSLEIS